MKKLIILIALLFTTLQGQNRIEEIDSLMGAGDYQEIVKRLEGNIVPDSSEYHLWFALGKAYQNMFNYAKAKDALYSAYKFNKFDLPLIMALGKNYVYMGAPYYSLLFFEQAVELQPENQSVLLDLGRSYYDVREFEKSANVYESLLQMDTTNAYFYKQLAQCYYKQRKWSAAISLLEKSFQINPRDANVAFQLGGLLVNQKEYDRAVEVIREGQTHNGYNIQLNKLAAETLFKMRYYDGASNQYELVISQGDSTALNYQKLGFCYYYLESPAVFESPSRDSLFYLNSIKAFSKAVELDSTDALSNVYLGICFKERGEYETSISFLEEGIQLSFPGYLADAYAQLGSSYELDGNYSESIKAYKDAQNYDPTREELTFHLASVYDRHYKDHSVPIMYYKKYLEKVLDGDPSLREYAQSRMDYLIEKQHFGN